MATRRMFLAGLAAATLPRASWADMGSPAYLAAAKSGDAYALHGLSLTGNLMFSVPLPSRGHAAAAHPLRAEAVAFARRPGVFALVFNCLDGQIAQTLTPPEGRQFNGHGTFSVDGSLLMTSEVVAETSDGLVGLWETDSYRRIGEWRTGGLGPHDLKRLPDGRIVVANGGIRTDPKDRTKLNLDQMQPSLTVLSALGEIEDQAFLPDLPQNSIRHLALAGEDIAFAMQWEGDPNIPVPQLGLWRPGNAPRLCPADPAAAFAMKGYAGSIASGSGLLGMTSAPCGVVMLFTSEGVPVATHKRTDISGIAAGPNGVMATDGLGGIWAVEAAGLTLKARHPVAWDNHLVALA